MMGWKNVFIKMNKTYEESRRQILTEMNSKSTEKTEKMCGELMKSKEESAKESQKGPIQGMIAMADFTDIHYWIAWAMNV